REKARGAVKNHANTITQTLPSDGDDSCPSHRAITIIQKSATQSRLITPQSKPITAESVRAIATSQSRGWLPSNDPPQQRPSRSRGDSTRTSRGRLPEPWVRYRPCPFFAPGLSSIF